LSPTQAIGYSLTKQGAEAPLQELANFLKLLPGKTIPFLQYLRHFFKTLDCAPIKGFRKMASMLF